MKGKVKWLFLISGAVLWTSCTQLTSFDMPEEDTTTDPIEDEVTGDEGDEGVTEECGNSVVEGDEDCDDGNSTPDDGCENDCTYSCTEDDDCDDDHDCTVDECGSDHACANEPAANTVVCRAATGACDIEELCDGVDEDCPFDLVQDNGFVCGSDPRSICLDSACEESECGDGFIDLGGDEQCEPPSEGNCTAECLLECEDNADCPDDGEDCNGTEYCDTVNFICAHEDPLEDGTECQADPRLICIDQTCQASTCGDEYTDTVVDPAEECDDGANGDDTDGCTDECAFTCEAETEADDCDDELPCTDDVCAADTHTCTNEVSANTVVCREDSGGGCDVEELCDGTETSCPADAFEAVDIECRALVAGGCDLAAEVCTGDSADCPVDTFAADTVECRAADGVCDVAELCPGTGPACPDDAVAENTVVCLAADGVCDVEETCDGALKTCPTDAVAENTVECRASAGDCDIVENCNGTDKTCPTDAFAAGSVECRVSAGACDVAENCPGDAAACPADGFRASDYECRASAGDCDVAENCPGDAAACPTDVFEAGSVECRASAGACDIAEDCPGDGAACPTDAFELASVVCRAAADPVCDIAENCPGDAAACPTDAVTAEFTPCDDANACSMVDMCDATGGCAGTAECVVDTTSPIVGTDTGQANKRLGLCISDAQCDIDSGGDCATNGVTVTSSWNSWGDDAMANCTTYWALTTAAQVPATTYCYRFKSNGVTFQPDQSDACDGGCAGTGGGSECEVAIP